MLRWVKSLFAWRVAFVSGVWLYEFNEATGQRRATTCAIGCVGPINMGWLLDGEGMPLIDGVPAWRSRYRNQLPPGVQWC